MRYTGHNTKIPHKLMLDWNGWRSEELPFPSGTTDAIRQTEDLWHSDGFDLQQGRVRGDKAQLLFSITPETSPVAFSQRVKGRLQHALRQAGIPIQFSRKVSVRCLGDNTRADVEQYLGLQVDRGDFADPRFRERMKKYSFVREDVDLSEPAATAHGRYWYNLHLVLVVAGRLRLGDDALLSQLRDESRAVAVDTKCTLKAVSIMPDHLHFALRGNIEMSPKEIGLAFQNRLADVVGCRAWQDGFYVGTFSEYPADLILG